MEPNTHWSGVGNLFSFASIQVEAVRYAYSAMKMGVNNPMTVDLTSINRLVKRRRANEEAYCGGCYRQRHQATCLFTPVQPRSFVQKEGTFNVNLRKRALCLVCNEPYDKQDGDSGGAQKNYNGGSEQA